MLRGHLIATLSIILSSLVLMSSLHAAQVLGAAAAVDGVKKFLPQDEQNIAKALADYHNHPDKAVGKLLKDTSNKQVNVDGRSLRLLRDDKKDNRSGHRLAGSWLRAWWEQHTLSLR